jgi:uncharacterized protein
MLTDLAAKRQRLLETIRSYGPCAVAFSGGVDSAVVAKAAHLVWQDQATAVTGVSASLATEELAIARDVARGIGIRHIELPTDEFGQAEYTRNAPDRCYHCKTELYSQMGAWAAKLGVSAILNGANLDDRGDYRPGTQAAAEHRVRSPLIECELGKAEVRELAEHWSLPVWDKPASPCLSSRIAYGEEVTPERVAMIEQAEQYLRRHSLRELRVRYHRGDLARIEVPPAMFARLVESALAQELVAHFQSLGFKFVTLDLQGFRSGSLNALVSVESLLKSGERRAESGEPENKPDLGLLNPEP